MAHSNIQITDPWMLAIIDAAPSEAELHAALLGRDEAGNFRKPHRPDAANPEATPAVRRTAHGLRFAD